jgi:redox-sensitive bicupin YhaK (pirin superfamily)
MITVRPAGARGHANHGWLDTYHSFSFADYHDPAHMGFRALRVLNEDRVQPRQGFPTHPHREMEILTYVLEGALSHQDSTGHGGVIRPGEIQRMSAGRGITHSERNPSDAEAVHFLQVWIRPDVPEVDPGYAQERFPAEERRGRLRLVASRAGRDGSISYQTDTDLYAALLEPGETVTQALRPGRHAWLQVTRGRVTLNGHPLEAGDGAAASGEPTLAIAAIQPAEILLFDLA